GLCSHGNHLALVFELRIPVDLLEIRGLAAQTRPVVHQLDGDLIDRLVDQDHASSSGPISIAGVWARIRVCLVKNSWPKSAASRSSVSSARIVPTTHRGWPTCTSSTASAFSK